MAQVVVCRHCGHVGTSASKTPGSILIEVVLWLCLLLPGLVYSLWRLSARHRVCAKCASKDIVPVDSPIGRKLVAELQPPGAAALRY